MSNREIYESKLTDVEGALKLIESRDFIVCGLAGAEPREILKKLHTVGDNGTKDVIICNTLPLGNYEFINSDTHNESISNGAWFFSSGQRKAQWGGQKNVSYIPNHLSTSLTKRLYAMKDRRKVLLVVCSEMDKHGNISLSLSNTYEMQLLDEYPDTIIIAEVNKNFPRTFGDNQIHISKFAAIVETDYAVPELPIAPINEKDEKIGEYISNLIEDGSTIQLGIGGIPNAVAIALKGKKNLGIHTEMFTDGMIDLLECGAVNNSQKSIHKNKCVCTFALGTKRLYDFIDDNPSVEFHQGRYTNNPYVVGQNTKMVSINTTIEVDLTGQCCSETIGYKQFSSTGGQADTVIGAQICKEGKSFIALYSTVDAVNENGERVTISKIVPTLKLGSTVSLSRNDVHHVVTEYGVADLRGLSVNERAKRLIEIAHPDFREQLTEEAKKMNYI